MFVEFTKVEDDTPVSVNVKAIVKFYASGDGGTRLFLPNDERLTVTEEYDTVRSMVGTASRAR